MNGVFNDFGKKDTTAYRKKEKDSPHSVQTSLKSRPLITNLEFNTCNKGLRLEEEKSKLALICWSIFIVCIFAFKMPISNHEWPHFLEPRQALKTWKFVLYAVKSDEIIMLSSIGYCYKLAFMIEGVMDKMLLKFYVIMSTF